MDLSRTILKNYIWAAFLSHLNNFKVYVLCLSYFHFHKTMTFFFLQILHLENLLDSLSFKLIV